MSRLISTGYGTNDKPIIVKPKRGSRKNQFVANVGKLICFFDDTNNFPELDIPVEVMIKNPLFSKENGKLVGLRIKVVDPSRHELIAISGFERNGFDGGTRAIGFSLDGRERRHYSGDEVNSWSEDVLNGDFFTPGKTRVRFADNRQADLLNNGSRVSLIPTNVYVKRRKYEGLQGPRHLEGLAHLSDADYAHLERDTRFDKE